jgi:cephalosporin hydroxylase
MKTDIRIGHKWNHYQRLYNLHFEQRRSIVEIGVDKGASLISHLENGFEKVYGIDVNHCEPLPFIKTFQGDASNKKFMADFLESLGTAPLDAVIDDGSHRPYHQYQTFKILFPRISIGGVYCIEDLHVADKPPHWRLWCKLGLPSVPKLLRELYNQQHRWHSIPETEIRSMPFEIHMYPNILFIKKVSTLIFVEETRAYV